MFERLHVDMNVRVRVGVATAEGTEEYSGLEADVILVRAGAAKKFGQDEVGLFRDDCGHVGVRSHQAVL
jgi:hypothetical protein